MDQIADRGPAAGHRLRMDRDVLPGERSSATSSLYVFALAILLVYLCLAGQYESWIAPLAVILAVPLALIGPAIALGSVGLANNLYTQIGLMLLIALGAKNAILIVEVAREARKVEGKPIVEAAVEAARTALPADPDDLVRLHPGRGAAGDRDRRRRQLRASRSASACSAA